MLKRRGCKPHVESKSVVRLPPARTKRATRPGEPGSDAAERARAAERGPPGDGRNPHNKLVWDKASGSVKPAYPEGIADGCDPALEGHYTLADGTRVAPSFQLLRERVASCTPEWAQAITGIDAARIA